MRMRSRSFHRDVHSDTGGRRAAQRMRSRSASPNPHYAVAVEDQMAPHEVVWERFTAMFSAEARRSGRGRNEQGARSALFDPSRDDRGYASLEEVATADREHEEDTMPLTASKQSMAFEPQTTVMDLEHDIEVVMNAEDEEEPH